MKKLTIKIGLFLVSSSLIFSGCEKDKPSPSDPPLDETELITTVEISLTDSVTSASSTFVFNDPDGEGILPPNQIDTIQLKENRTYFAEVVLLDKSKNPADSISNEVFKEGDSHQFFYLSGLSGLNFRYTDQDVNGDPIGLKTTWITIGTGNGIIQLVLKHQPGIKDGLLVTGETDVDVQFPCVISN